MAFDSIAVGEFATSTGVECVDTANCVYVAESVEFTRHYGAFRKGEKVESLAIDFAAGQIQEFDEAGELKRFQDFKMVPFRRGGHVQGNGDQA